MIPPSGPRPPLAARPDRPGPVATAAGHPVPASGLRRRSESHPRLQPDRDRDGLRLLVIHDPQGDAGYLGDSERERTAPCTIDAIALQGRELPALRVEAGHGLDRSLRPLVDERDSP